LNLSFTKMHGAGNDFVVVDGEDDGTNWGRLALAVCDRHYGIGGDGLLVLTSSAAADIGMRIFNADGSEASACGNGLRCIVKYYLDKKGIPVKEGKVTVETLSGVRQAWFTRTEGSSARVRVGMGIPGPEMKPLTGGPQQVDIKSLEYNAVVHGEVLRLGLVSMGNLHAVHFIQTPVAGFALAEIGPTVEHYPYFPRSANFEVARVLDEGHIEARVWENGVGETLACGSGACAIAVAARVWNLANDSVMVSLPGGNLGIEWDGNSEVYLTGPAETVFRGEWLDLDLDRFALARRLSNEVLA
jgi:diaminopimelate epimerase